MSEKELSLSEQSRKLYRRSFILLAVSITLGIGWYVTRDSSPGCIFAMSAAVMFLIAAYDGIRGDLALMAATEDKLDWDIINGVGTPKKDKEGQGKKDQSDDNPLLKPWFWS